MAPAARELGHRTDVDVRAGGVACPLQCHDPGTGGYRVREDIHVQPGVGAHSDGADQQVMVGGSVQPGSDVRVMVQDGNDDLLARPHPAGGLPCEVRVQRGGVEPEPDVPGSGAEKGREVAPGVGDQLAGADAVRERAAQVGARLRR
jgi:hypothetical protein